MKRKDFGQLLNLSIDLIPEGRPNRPGDKLDALDFITIHNTSNVTTGADADAHAKFVSKTGFYVLPNGRKTQVSWHYTVDDTRIIKHLPIEEVGWHAGARKGNHRSIGIEICMNKGIDQNAAFQRASRLVAALLFDLKKGTDAVVPHHHWTGKNCPILLLNDGKPKARWKDFLKMVSDELATIEPN